MLKGVFPHIYWTPCAVHCINLIFGDIFKERPFTGVFTKAVTANLRSLFISEEWNTSKFAKEVTGKEVALIMLSYTFWNHVVHALNVGGPLIKKNNLLNKEVWKGFHKCVAKLVVDEDVQDSITNEISTYKSADGLFGLQIAIRQRAKKSPVEWWRLYGLETPELQKFAIKVLHTKKRNRLTLKCLNDLVFIKYNITLRRCYNARNVIDPICLDNIDDANEWLTGVDYAEDEEIFEENFDFTWFGVGEVSAVEENRYDLRGNTSSSYRRGKEVATSLFLVDEVERDSDT
ncbi:hypothetical protein KY290_032717 [Solanum tuberosum]|uniref:DUF659 domain-containing protein n=1 Tax=Solanum tuberosum TaxID=4113 RepID=A0ABQ7UEI3_SOLTU|nr:hypothetical protein KY290_032717 [Solanum tuberosum]